MFHLEKSITQWLRSFRKYRAFDHGTVREMELHLRDHIDDLITEGYSEKAAFEAAVAEFGDIKTMAMEEFQAQKRKPTLRSLIHTAMFRNYSLITLRSMMKNPLSSFINLFGLSMAIGLCVFAYAYAQWVYSTDQFHENKNEVHLITFSANRDGNIEYYARTPRPLGEMLKQDFPQITNMCRVEDRNVVIKHEDNVFHERVRFTDADFLEMFTFPLQKGSAGTLKDINSIIISDNTATKYFGDKNPVGQDLLIKFNESTSKIFKVTGVADKFPVSKTISFDFLINIENLKSLEKGYDFRNWAKFVNATFIQVKRAEDVAIIQDQMEKYRLVQNKASEPDWNIASFEFEPLATLHKRSVKLRDHIARNSDDNYSSILFLGAVGGFILLLACFNYINIAIVSAAKRLKELGIRKTIGASRSAIVLQFLTENIVVTAFALAVGLLIGMTVFIPWFEGIWGFNMGFQLDKSQLWMFLGGILLVTALLSGSYPAFYISRFQVTGILKGKVKFGQKNTFTKVILGAQLIVATIFITLAVTFTLNTNYLKNRSWGYDKAEVAYVAVHNQAAFEKMQALMAQDPDVISISGSDDHLGRKSNIMIMHFPDRQFEVDELAVDANYINTMGLTLVDGRNFNNGPEGDRHSVLVNETLVESLAITDPVGEVFRVDSVQCEIIGVVKDFHNYNFTQKIKPTVLRLAEQEDYSYLSLKINKGAEQKVHKNAQAHWATLYPEIPFNGGYQEDVWGGYFNTQDIYAEVWLLFSSIAIILASLGLYGLVKLNIEGRVREFSIRKVLGAGIPVITYCIISQYMMLIIGAIVIGAPASYYMIKLIFDSSFDYHIPITFDLVAIGVAIFIAVIVLTISTQIRRVVVSDTVEGLKTE